MSLPLRIPPPPLGVGFVCVPPAWVTEGGRGGSIEAAVTFFVARLRPFARASSSLEPIFPVFGASLSHCPPCAALSAEFFLGRPLGRGPRPGPKPKRPPMADAYGHTTGNTPEPVRFQQLTVVRPN